MACDSPPGIHATAKGRSLLAGNVCLPEAGMPDDLGRDGIGAVVDPGSTRLQRREHPFQLGGRRDRLAVDGNDHVSDVHPGFRSRSTRRYRADERTPSVRVANVDPEVCPVRVDHVAVCDDLAGDLRNETPSTASACQRFGSGAPIGLGRN